MANTAAAAGNEHEDHIDACVCDIAVSDSEAMPDSELPVAQGGVEARAMPDGAGEEIDGCDVEFTEADALADEELPTAVGGIA